jgi:hypothetical protein
VNAVPIEATFQLANSFSFARKFSSFANIFKVSEFVKPEGEDFGCMSDALAPSQWNSVIREKVVKNYRVTIK